jgi:hypothetical protein
MPNATRIKKPGRRSIKRLLRTNLGSSANLPLTVQATKAMINRIPSRVLEIGRLKPTAATAPPATAYA